MAKAPQVSRFKTNPLDWSLFRGRESIPDPVMFALLKRRWLGCHQLFCLRPTQVARIEAIWLRPLPLARNRAWSARLNRLRKPWSTALRQLRPLLMQGR